MEKHHKDFQPSGEFDKEQVSRHILNSSPDLKYIVKPMVSLFALTAVLAVALMALDPMTSGAAVSAPGSSLESVSGAGNTLQQCPTEKPTNQNDCATTGGERTMKTGKVLPLILEGDHEESTEPGDAAGALLEELVKVADH